VAKKIAALSGKISGRKEDATGYVPVLPQLSMNLEIIPQFFV
jgi:hypothetical protein